MKTLALTAAALVATSFAAHAYDNPIDRTQSQQKHAIEQGRYSGQLTRREYRALLAEQEHIADLERRAKADGHLSRREFWAIRQAQSEAGRHIYSESHDGQSAFWRRWLYRHRY